jgi:hypothetical protein
MSITPDQLADKCEEWLRNTPSTPNPVDAFEAGYRMAEAAIFPFTIDVRHILGKPNFACAHIAERMRTVMRHNIPRKAEEEQAAVIYFCLGHYLKHGAEWAVHADAELNGDRKPS